MSNPSIWPFSFTYSRGGNVAFVPIVRVLFFIVLKFALELIALTINSVINANVEINIYIL